MSGETRREARSRFVDADRLTAGLTMAARMLIVKIR